MDIKAKNYELERLEALNKLAILDTPPEERFDKLVRLATELLDVPIGYIAFLDEERQWFKARKGLAAKQTPRSIAFCNHTIQQEEPLVIPDTLLDQRFSNSPLVQKSPHIRFYAGIPLASPNGFNIGTFCVANTSPMDIAPQQLAFLLELAGLAEDQIVFRDANASLRKIKKQLELRNDFIRKIFSHYMSDEVVTSILDSKTHKLGGQELKVTSLFSDIRNFVPLSSSLPAEELVKLLNIYFTKMVQVIEKYRGTIQSFIGDAILVIFGAPHSTADDSLRAIACAIEMQQVLNKLNKANHKKNLPEFKMGIGINTGLAVVGNIGSQKRMQYSAIGSSINLSSRIQELCLGDQVLITEATYQETQQELEINGHLRVRAKGFIDPIHIYDVAGVRGAYKLHL